MRITWTEGMTSALDAARIPEGRDIGAIRVRDLATGADHGCVISVTSLQSGATGQETLSRETDTMPIRSLVLPACLSGAAALLAPVGAGHAQECPVAAADAYEMSGTDVQALYACLSEAMPVAYAQGGDPVAAVYRSWTVTGIRPGPDPSHGDRLLLTFANDLAAETYLKFATEGVEMPVGAVLAKESIAIRDGSGRIGPLFIMEKVGLDAAPETGGWRYAGVQPNGKPLGAPQSFCHDCHALFEGQDGLAYPAPDLRVGG